MISVFDIGNITNVLEAMIHYELLLSDFYQRCAQVWTEDLTFWNDLAIAETRHADNIKLMKDIIVKKRESFAMGRPFNLIALKTVTAGLEDNIRRLTLGEYSRDKILIVARDIEQSVLESNYAEIVTTLDIEYNNLMREIIAQTHDHKKNIQEKITPR